MEVITHGLTEVSLWGKVVPTAIVESPTGETSHEFYGEFWDVKMWRGEWPLYWKHEQVEAGDFTVDAKMFPLLETLWLDNYRTRYSCQGGEGEEAYIMFETNQLATWFSNILSHSGYLHTMTPNVGSDQLAGVVRFSDPETALRAYLYGRGL